jgi:hypothetical protein
MNFPLCEIVNNSSLDQDDQLLIFVSFPNLKTKKLRICSSNPISVVFQLFPQGNKTVFYQGEIIEHSESFLDFGMSNNDRIVVIPTENLDFKNEVFWRNATKRDIETKKQIQIIQDPFLRNLFSRQQDLQLFKVEQKPISSRKIIANFQFLKNIQPNDYIPTFSDFPSGTKPSEESLPILW